jgi:hypothetical protein
MVVERCGEQATPGSSLPEKWKLRSEHELLFLVPQINKESYRGVPVSCVVVVGIYLSRTLVGSAVMPIGVLEVNPAIPHAALSTTPLSGSFASYMLLRNSLAEPLFRLLRKLFHGELPQIGSPGFVGLMIPHAGDTFELFGTLRQLSG